MPTQDILHRFSSCISRIKHLTLFQWLIIVTILYLFWQISLSGAILTATTMQQSDRLSSLAQKTVGFGVALFVFRSACRRMRFTALIPLALLAGWGAMLAEDGIVNYFAERTSAQARLEAKKIQFFNNAQALNKVRLTDLAKNIADSEIRSRAFGKVLGFAIWNNPVVIEQINSLLPSILNAVYAQEAYAKIDAAYAKYAQKYEKGAAELHKAEALLTKINFADSAHHLNQQLGKYAGCLDEECRRKVTNRVNAYMRRFLPDLDMALNLEEFCRQEKMAERYVMGRPIGAQAEKVCSVTEKSLYQWLAGKLAARKGEAIAGLKGVPERIGRKLLDSDFLSPAQWRELWREETEKDMFRRAKTEFGQAQEYGEKGKLAKEGRAYAISVFLPPVALGFSISVCFLHFASLCAALTRKPLICGVAALICWALPAFFATSVPLGGFAGVYGRWLVFWEGVLYPFGIFRQLIL